MKKAPKCIPFLILVVFIALTFMGCTSRMLDFTVVSNKNVALRIKDEGKGPRVTGSHHVWWIIFFPFGSPNLEEAVDRAIESAGPGYDALIDGVIYNQFHFYFFASRVGYKVEGTPIKSSEIIAEFELKGKSIEKAKEEILYHSSTGIDNSKNFERIKKSLNQTKNK